MFFRDWLLRHPPISVLVVVALLLLLISLFPGSQRPPEPTRIQEISGVASGTATEATKKVVDLAEQIDSVFRAPVPFFLALFAVLSVSVLGMWRALEWAYQMRLEKAEFYIKMAGQEHELRERLDERLAELDKKSTPDAEVKGIQSERQELIHRRRAANNAVTLNLNAASTATTRRPDFVYHPPTRYEATATTLGSEAAHPPTARKPDHR
jgi:hypothetical protein